MRQSAAAQFWPLSSALEGVVFHMYLDIISLVTIGIGNLIDPIQHALHLPFLHGDGRKATRDEIATEWRTIKNYPGLARNGHKAAASVAKLHLTPSAVEALVLSRMASNEGILRARLPRFDEWPADAQLATHSQAWACGAGFHFPWLIAALNAYDFASASRHCHIDESGRDKIIGTDDDNHGVIPRNVANKQLFRNAAIVNARKLDPNILLTPWIQEALRACGYDVGPVDGLFGKRTEAAVVSFQVSNGLTADGLLGPITFDALRLVSGLPV